MRRDLVNSSDPPDVILLEERWLTPANLFFLERKLTLIMHLVGRPYGGTSILINKNSSGDEIVNVNFYVVRPQATRIR